MKLNYTQRMILSMIAFSFASMLVVFTIIWLLIEASEDPDDSANRVVGPVVEAVMQNNIGNVDSYHSEEFDIYFSWDALPNELRQKLNLDETAHSEGLQLLSGINPANEQPYYIAWSGMDVSGFVVEEFDDMVLVLMTAIVTALVLFFGATKMSRRLSQPVVSLTHAVQNLSPDDDNFPVLYRDDEISQLSQAFADLFSRMKAFAARERDFTRFASHELRSPAAVIRGNIDLLKKDNIDAEVARRALERLDSSSHRMTLLIDAFLYLGRESDRVESEQLSQVDLAGLEQILTNLLSRATEQERSRVHWQVGVINWALDVSLLTIVLDNLMRNALQHCAGAVQISVSSDKIEMRNPVGDELAQSREGIGLQIVERICELNDWGFSIATEAGQFVVSIDRLAGVEP